MESLGVKTQSGRYSMKNGGSRIDSRMSVQGPREREMVGLNLKKETLLWASQLKNFVNPKAVIVGLIENEKLKKIALVQIINHLKDIDLYEQTVEVHYLPSPKFVFISFENEQSALRFKELSYYIDSLQTVFITGQEKIETCNVFINSLPIEVIKKLVVPILEKWAVVLKIVPNTLPRENGMRCNVGQIKLQLQIKEGFTIDSIPYFIRVFNCKVYLHIPGKQKICYRCGESDHLIQACENFFCPLCRAIKSKSHLCGTSYAQITRGKNENKLSFEVLEDQDLINLPEIHAESVDMPTENKLAGMDLVVDRKMSKVIDAGDLALTDLRGIKVVSDKVESVNDQCKSLVVETVQSLNANSASELEDVSAGENCSLADGDHEARAKVVKRKRNNGAKDGVKNKQNKKNDLTGKDVEDMEKKKKKLLEDKGKLKNEKVKGNALKVMLKDISIVELPIGDLDKKIDS